MSRREDFKQFNLKRSDSIIDFTCTSCKNEYEFNGGIHYCARCQEYYFRPVTEEINEISGTFDHFLRRSKDMNAELQMGDVGDLQPESPQQTGGAVWSCSVNVPVVSNDHRYVIDKHISAIGNQTLGESLNLGTDNGTIQNHTVRANFFKQSAEELQTRKLKLLEKLKEMKEKCLQSIKAFRIKINEIIDRLEKNTVTELENMFREKENEFTIEVNNMEEVIVNQQQDNMIDLQQDSVYKQTSETLQRFLNEESDIGGDIIFTQNNKLLQFLASLHSLGFCDYQEKNNLYKIQSSDIVNISHSSDTEVCSVHSCCFLSSGDILMSDYKNKNIKVIDGSCYTVKDVLQFQLYPLSVCEVNEKEAAVTLAEAKYFSGDNRIQFISTKNDKLLPTRSIRLDHCCTGIGMVDDKIYVSNERKRVYVYDTQGKLIHTLYTDQYGNELFSKSYSIFQSRNKKRVHITDLDKGLVTLDSDGRLLWKFSGQKLQMAWGVCTDCKGNIFVSGGNSGNVLQIGSDGTCLGEIVSGIHEIKDPQAICFDKRKSSLIMTKYNSNHMHIFSLASDKLQNKILY